MINEDFFNKDFDLKKKRVKEICASAGKTEKEFIDGTMFGILIGMGLLAHKAARLNIEEVNGAMGEFREIADLLNVALTKDAK